jgi:Sulfotransferase family
MKRHNQSRQDRDLNTLIPFGFEYCVSFPEQETMMQLARALFRAEERKDLRSLIANKTEEIRHFDIAGMERAVAICTNGPTGSILLASFLDGHNDVIMMPKALSERIYHFFERYRSLSLYEKLIAYPVFLRSFYVDLFQQEFPIAATHYYAAIKAVIEVYGKSPREFLESRRTFFKLLHVAYSVALGRLPTGRRPLIVYAQHRRDDKRAQYLVEDFPRARFIHTVRDPISNYSRSLDLFWGLGFSTAGKVMRCLTKEDEPHTAMEARTRAVRFEDLHLHLEKTMRSVAAWLDLQYLPSLLESTFNGVPWIVTRGTASWSGARPTQAIRNVQNTSITDRGLLFALFRENFVTWNYPCPKSFRYTLVRFIICILVVLIPTKMEVIIAYRLVKSSVRHTSFRFAIDGFVRILGSRVAVMCLTIEELCRRLMFGKKVLELL